MRAVVLAVVAVACVAAGVRVRAGNVTATVHFANENWNCAEADCSSRVSEGTYQPNYECAEFVARSLAAGDFVTNIHPLAPQSDFGSYRYAGATYDLLWTSSFQSGILGVEDLIRKMGWVNKGTDASVVKAGCVLLLDGSLGAKSHIAIGVEPQLTDAHNMAHYKKPISVYEGVNAIYWSQQMVAEDEAERARDAARAAHEAADAARALDAAAKPQTPAAPAAPTAPAKPADSELEGAQNVPKPLHVIRDDIPEQVVYATY